jgi:hypothetical protein
VDNAGSKLSIICQTLQILRQFAPIVDKLTETFFNLNGPETTSWARRDELALWRSGGAVVARHQPMLNGM